jgi:glycosyltransferase involved in cell wall biosynthesis
MFEITLPVLNEEKILKQNVYCVHDFILQELPEHSEWKIIIADNGSTDRTQEIGTDLALQNPRIQYIRLEERGVGLALQTSWSKSNAGIIGYMDLDLATDLKHFKETLTKLNSGCELVYGSRLNKKSKVKGRTLKREFTSRCFNFIARNYLGVHFSDGMCGFKFMKREIYSKLHAGGARSKGWFFSTELLVVAEWLGMKVCELPVEWTDSEESHVRILPLTLQYLKSMRTLKSLKPDAK